MTGLSTNDVGQEIISMIADVTGFDEKEITLETDLVKDLEVDSIKAIEIVVAVEKKYKISIRDEDVPSITVPRQIVDLTNKLLTEKEANV